MHMDVTKRTVNDVLDRFEKEVVPTLGERTQKDYARHIRRLRREYGARVATQLQPRDFGEFMRIPEGGKGGIQRNRIMAVLSSVFGRAVDWGWLTHNVCQQVPRNPTKTRERNLTDEDFEGARKLAKPRFRPYMDLALLTRQPQGSLLKLRWDQVHDHVILFRDQKTRKKIEIDITPEIRAALEGCKWPKARSDYVICKRNGTAYTSEGFRAIWQRLMRKWARTGNDRFTFPDIRAMAQRRFEARQARKTELTSAVADYPQFAPSVRDEAAVMAEYYQVFYCLEQTIRQLVVNRLTTAEGPDWWNSGRVPVETMSAANKLRQREQDTGITPRSANMLDYTTFGELSGIITSNWDVFEPAFHNKAAIPRVLHSLNLLRGPVAHSCAMSSDEIERLGIAVKDWFRQIK